MKTSDIVTSETHECSTGYITVSNPSSVECEDGKCSDKQCCDKVCSSFECRKPFSPVEDADTKVCRRDRCNKRQCCVKGETRPLQALQELGGRILILHNTNTAVNFHTRLLQ